MIISLSLGQMSLIIASVVFLTLGFSILLGLKKFDRWEKLFKSPAPLIFTSKSDKKTSEELMRFIKRLPKLSLEEKNILLCRLFGRACRIQIGIDQDGSHWFENVSPFVLENDSEFAYHFHEKKEKDRSIG